MMKFLLPVLLSGVSLSAAAQQPMADDAWEEQGPPRWGVGLAALATDSVYAGEGTRVMPIPMVMYNGERFSFRGITASWRLFGDEAFSVSALGKFRFDGFSTDDLGREELARNGIDRALLEDRDKGFDLGLGMGWRGAAGELELELLADVTDASGGQEANLQYGYPIQLGKGMLTPQVGVTWQSSDMADYYYGTLDKEIARGVVAYRPGSVTLGHVGVQYMRPLGEHWSMNGFAKYTTVPDEIKDSPLVERDTDGTASVFLGISRGF